MLPTPFLLCFSDTTSSFIRAVPPLCRKVLKEINRIKIILINLFSNAFKFTPKGGKIDFETKKKDDIILLTVSDSGCGIPRRQQSKIFTKFFRADTARELDTKGTGLGLYIVKALVEALNGKIWFESKEGQGTIFYLAVPIKGAKRQSGTKDLEPM